MNGNATLTFDSACALKHLPELFVNAGATWAINGYLNDADEVANRTGSFWNLAPDWYAGSNVELILGMLTPIMREYHSDEPIC